MSTATAQRRHRAWRTSQGLCIDCSEPAVPGRTRCQKHLEANRRKAERRRLAHQRAGRCSQCNAPAIPGLTICEYHRQMRMVYHVRSYEPKGRKARDPEKAKATKRAYYERRKASGCCARCGGPRTDERIVCQLCRDYQKLYRDLKKGSS